MKIKSERCAFNGTVKQINDQSFDERCTIGLIIDGCRTHTNLSRCTVINNIFSTQFIVIKIKYQKPNSDSHELLTNVQFTRYLT